MLSIKYKWWKYKFPKVSHISDKGTLWFLFHHSWSAGFLISFFSMTRLLPCQHSKQKIKLLRQKFYFLTSCIQLSSMTWRSELASYSQELLILAPLFNPVDSFFIFTSSYQVAIFLLCQKIFWPFLFELKTRKCFFH